MKFARTSRNVVALAVALFLLLGSTPAWSQGLNVEPDAESTSPAMFDLFILRPVGFVALVVGSALFIAPVAPLTLITRPSQINKPFEKMVVAPARYVFADPLGEH